MNTITETQRKETNRPNWDAIINSTKAGITFKERSVLPGKHKLSPGKNTMCEIEMVCTKLKNDLEWYCNLPENIKSKKLLKKILEQPSPVNSSGKLIEKWWINS